MPEAPVPEPVAVPVAPTPPTVAPEVPLALGGVGAADPSDPPEEPDAGLTVASLEANDALEGVGDGDEAGAFAVFDADELTD